MSNWPESSWGEIAFEVARRAALFSLRDSATRPLIDRSSSRFLRFSRLETLAKRRTFEQDDTPAWWIHAPILHKLLGNGGIAALVTLGQFHHPQKFDLHREWCNFLGPDSDDEALRRIIFLASMLNQTVEVDGSQLEFTSWLLLTTDTLERTAEAETAPNPLRPYVLDFDNVGERLKVYEALRFDARHVKAAFLDTTAIKIADVPAEEDFPPFEIDRSSLFATVRAVEEAVSSLSEEVRSKIDEWCDTTPGLDSPPHPARLLRGASWLRAIASACHSEGIIAIPAWLPPSVDGIHTGSLVIYARRAVERSEFLDLVSAFHSASLLYLGRSENYRIAELEKDRRRLESLARPLRVMTGALKRVQLETRELHAAVFSPSESVFEASHLVHDLFEDAGPLEIAPGVTLARAHTFGHIEQLPELQKILAVVLCSFFGRREDLRSSPSDASLLARARDVLKQIELDALRKDEASLLLRIVNAHDETSASLTTSWLVRSGETDKDAAARLRKLLETLKSILFTPFKEDKKWPCPPLHIAALGDAADQKDLALEPPHAGKRTVTIDYALTPFPLRAILDFLIAARLEYSRRPDAESCFKSLGIAQGSPPNVTLRITYFGKAPFFTKTERPGLQRFLTLLCEFGVGGRNYGNFYAMFARLCRFDERIRSNGTSRAEWRLCLEGELESNELLRFSRSDASSIFRIMDIHDRSSQEGVLSLSWETNGKGTGLENPEDRPSAPSAQSSAPLEAVRTMTPATSHAAKKPSITARVIDHCAGPFFHLKEGVKLECSDGFVEFAAPSNVDHPRSHASDTSDVLFVHTTKALQDWVTEFQTARNGLIFISTSRRGRAEADLPEWAKIYDEDVPDATELESAWASRFAAAAFSVLRSHAPT